MRVLPKLIATAILAASLSFGGTITYIANLDGPSENPPRASPATGFATVTIDDTANTMRVEVSFSGLLGTTLASHIHCCTVVPDAGNAGVATVTPTFTDFPGGVTSGTYDHTFDLTDAGSYNPAFFTTSADTESRLLAGLAAGEAYLNIHSTLFTSGEIRGFLAAETPEPGTLGLAGVVLLGLFAARKRFQFLKG